MKLYSIHNGKKINYFLGILIGIDQALGAFAPGANLDETISSRIGRRKLKMGGKIPFWRHPLAATIDWFLERIDENHSIEAIGQ